MAKKTSNTKSFILRVDSDTMNAIEAWAAAPPTDSCSGSSPRRCARLDVCPKNGRRRPLRRNEYEFFQMEFFQTIQVGL